MVVYFIIFEKKFSLKYGKKQEIICSRRKHPFL